ncbi:helix-turn-helix transcriptional regulator [Novosphingobium sp. G106]|uniref:response regulator transcription factor n=1 Tax=Novosphingobium sp. G106 TaxID=2849500 RepID=UPI001C2D1242|nr:helix-turn-helix transcriptional regulator [Novosphingobium sp. G106]MBV1687766.1 helix-turn-helix transcriptional regulator [Novosphingobium sp. G106]
MSVIQHIPTLTNRELQLLMLVALGYSAKEVAKRCGIAFRTVETHLGTMRLKLRARNRTHMVAIAIELGLISSTQIRQGSQQANQGAIG